MTRHLKLLLVMAVILTPATSLTTAAQANDDLMRLLQSKNKHCQQCQLSDVDLIYSDLRDANLQGASLQRANLSKVNLDGANLQNADLSFTTLQGASLRGADLRGSRLYGTDLRFADLSGAQLDPEALDQSHWHGAKGISTGVRSHASLHNAGVEAAQSEQWDEAERLFSEAIQNKPDEPLSWVARGLSRGELGRFDSAAKDLAYAGRLFEQEGDQAKAEQLAAASERLKNNSGADNSDQSGNGMGSALLGGALSTIQSLAPLALKALMPLIP